MDEPGYDGADKATLDAADEAANANDLADLNTASAESILASGTVTTGVAYADITYPIDNEDTFNTLINEWLETPYLGEPYQPYVGFRDGRIIYMKIGGKTTAGQFEPAALKEPAYNLW